MAYLTPCKIYLHIIIYSCFFFICCINDQNDLQTNIRCEENLHLDQYAELAFQRFEIDKAINIYDSLSKLNISSEQYSLFKIRTQYFKTFDLNYHFTENNYIIDSSKSILLKISHQILKISSTVTTLDLTESALVYQEFLNSCSFNSELELEYLFEKGQYFRYVERNLDSVEYYLYKCFEKIKLIDKKPSLYGHLLVELAHFATTKRQNKRSVYFMRLALNENGYLINIPEAYKWYFKRKYAYMLWRLEEDEGKKSIEILKECFSYFSKNDLQKESQLSLRYGCIIATVFNDEDSYTYFIDSLTEKVNQHKTDYANLPYLMGNEYYYRKNYAKAIPYLEEAMEKRSKIKPVDPLFMDAIIGRLVNSYNNTGKPEKAIDLRIKTLKYSTYKNRSPSDLPFENLESLGFYDLMVLAESYSKKFILDNKLTLGDTAIYLTYLCDQIFQKSIKIKEEDAILEYYRYKDRIFGNGMEVAYENFIKTQNPKYKADFYYFSQRSRAEYLENQNAVTKGTTEFEIRNLERKILGSSDISEINLLMAKLIDYEQSLAESQSLKSKPNILPLEKLQVDSNFVYYLFNCNKDQIFLQTISKNQHQLLKVDLDTTIINLYINLIQDPYSDYKTLINLSNIIYDRFKLNTVKSGNIIIQADKYLQKLSFSSLSKEENGIQKYFIEDHNILYIRNLKKPPSKEIINLKRSQGFSFSNRDFGISALKLPDIPYGIKEVELLNQNSNNLYYGIDKEIFLSKLKRNSDYIHLALHGKANSDRIHDICLFFKNEYKGLDTLYPHELPDEIPAKCIFLSACESNQGYHALGEGVFNLTSAFHSRGVKYVISSNWNVDDKSGFMITKFFVKELKQGSYISKSLVSAQAAVRGQNKHPYYWAGFGVHI